MKHNLFSRMLALVLALCLLPSFALAFNGDESPVTRSDFTAQLQLHADGFPVDGLAHYKDWEAFLSKLSLRGVLDMQNFLQPLSRFYFNGGLYLEDENVLPFDYDAYAWFRYITSPALRGENIAFVMTNFFQFMLKGYYFLGIPSQLAALPLYPTATVEMAQNYWGPITEAFAGEESRVVEYADLYELCETLNLIVQEDENEKAYYYFTSLLIELGASDMVLDRLAFLEDWLDYLDPDCLGMSIQVDGEYETWTLGETVVFEKTDTGFTLTLPDYEGYLYTLQWDLVDGDLWAQLLVTLDEEERLNLSVNATGLPGQDDLAAQGRVDIYLEGEALYQELPPICFAFDYARTAQTLPYDLSLTVDWLHPETDEPAIGMAYQASMQEEPHTVIIEKEYQNREDLMHFNEDFMARLKERYLPTVALSLVPVVLEVPSGVISDVIAFLDATGLLAFLGIE